MTEFKKGDLVKVVRKFRSDEGDLCWMPAMDKLVGTTAKVERIYVDGDVYLDCGWWFYPHVLEHVNKPRAACILVDKKIVNGVHCYEILGFEGILGQDKLPAKYIEGAPSFDLYKSSASHYEFDGHGMQWKSVDGVASAVSYNIPRDSDPIIGLGPLPVHVLTVGDIYPETTFQAIVVWLKRAGSRLAKIRKQEKDAWSGKETIEI